MADTVKDVQKAINAVNTRAFRLGTENIFPMMPEFQKRGIDLQRPEDTMSK